MQKGVKWYVDPVAASFHILQVPSMSNALAARLSTTCLKVRFVFAIDFSSMLMPPLNFQLQLIYGKPNCMFFRASSRASEVRKLSSASDVPLWCSLSSVLLLLVSHLHWSMHSLLLLFSNVDDPWMNDSCWSSVLFMIDSFQLLGYPPDGFCLKHIMQGRNIFFYYRVS